MARRWFFRIKMGKYLFGSGKRHIFAVRKWDGGEEHRGVAQSGSASALGAEGRRFESCHPDRGKEPFAVSEWLFSFCMARRVWGVVGWFFVSGLLPAGIVDWGYGCSFTRRRRERVRVRFSREKREAFSGEEAGDGVREALACCSRKCWMPALSR